PVHRHERPRRDEPAGLAVGDEEEAVAVGLHVDRRLLAADIDVGEHQLVDAVIVPGLGRRRLDLPFDLAGIGIDGEGARAAGIGELAEIGRSGAAHRRVPRRRIAGAVESRVGLGIVGADIPGGAAAMLPAVAFPGVVAGLAGARDGPGLPQLLAAGDIIGLERAARAVFAAGEADDRHVFDDERRRGVGLAVLVVDDL